MVKLSVHLEIQWESKSPASVVLIVQPQTGAGQTILKNELILPSRATAHEFKDLYGNRCLRLILPAGEIRIESNILASTTESIDVHPTAEFCSMESLPDEILHFVLPSRYCESDELENAAQKIVGDEQPGYRQVERIRSWINSTFIYEQGSSNSHTSARDAIAKQKGVCRDFAHAGIALTRSLNVPARMVVGYLDGLIPMDLHAWYGAFIGNRWYTFDPTQGLPKGGRIIIAYGRDAADVAIATHFSDINMQNLCVEMQRLP